MIQASIVPISSRDRQEKVMAWGEKIMYDSKSLVLLCKGAFIHTSLFNQDVSSAISFAKRHLSCPGGLMGRSSMPRARVSLTLSSPLPCKCELVAIHYQLQAATTMASLNFSWNPWVSDIGKRLEMTYEMKVSSLVINSMCIVCTRTQEKPPTWTTGPHLEECLHITEGIKHFKECLY